MLKGGNKQKKSVIDLRDWDLEAQFRPKRPLDLRERVPETQVPQELTVKQPRSVGESSSFRRRARDVMAEPVQFYESLPGYFDAPLKEKPTKKIKVDWLLIGLVVGGMLLGIIINVVQGSQESGGSFGRYNPRLADRQEGAAPPEEEDKSTSTETSQQSATIPPAQNAPAPTSSSTGLAGTGGSGDGGGSGEGDNTGGTGGGNGGTGGPGGPGGGGGGTGGGSLDPAIDACVTIPGSTICQSAAVDPLSSDPIRVSRADL